MVAVAIVALSISATSWSGRRRARFESLVRQYYEKRYAASAFSYSGPGGVVMEARMRADAEQRAKVMAYYTELIAKYKRASRYPWLPVGPDPPEPARPNAIFPSR
jgi:hypothetical protein